MKTIRSLPANSEQRETPNSGSGQKTTMQLNTFSKMIRRNSRLTALVGLLALVLLQFTAAGHQFDHAGSDPQETCGFCLQLDRSDDAPQIQVLAVPSLVAIAVVVQPSLPVVRNAPSYRQKSRGPPRSA